MADDRRRWASRAVGLLLGIAALAGCASAPTSREWLVVEGPGLAVYCDGDLDQARAFYEEVERFRAAMRWFTNLTKAAQAKTRIMLFSRATDALPYQISKEIGAWATVTPTGNLAIAKLEGKTKEIDRQTLKRDLVRLWIEDSGVRTPTWYKEGLAELISAFTIEGDAVTVGGLPPVELATYAELIADEKKGHPPAALLGDEPARYELQDRARVWLTVHYLMVANQERREDLRKYFQVWSKGTAGADAFATAFGQPPGEFFRLEVGRYGARQLAARQFRMEGAIPEPKIREASDEEVEKLVAEVERAVQRLR